MEKAALRKNILANLKGQDKREKALVDKTLLDDFIQTKAYKEAKIIATYLAFDFEYDTQLLINQAEKDGKKFLFLKRILKEK